MRLNLDSDGYLSVLDDWNKSVAHELAALESIQLTQDHWELIELVRRYYQEFDHQRLHPVANAQNWNV